MHTYIFTHFAVRGQIAGVDSLLTPRRFQGLNSGFQTWQQVPSFAESPPLASPLYFLEQSLYLNLELSASARLTYWQVSGIFLSLPPEHWGHRYRPLLLPLMWVLGIELKYSFLCPKHFANWAIPQPPPIPTLRFLSPEIELKAVEYREEMFCAQGTCAIVWALAVACCAALGEWFFGFLTPECDRNAKSQACLTDLLTERRWDTKSSSACGQVLWTQGQS